MAVLDIALCITDLRVGGAERCLVQLATGLDRRRFRPVVYCLEARPDAEEASCVPELEAADIEVHCLGARHHWEFLRVLRDLRRLMVAQRPHLMQTFLLHANIVGRIAGWQAGVGHVVSGIRVAERRRRWRLWVDRATDRMVDRHVCVSRSVAQFAENQAGLRAEKLVVIPNGVDLRQYSGELPVESTVLQDCGIPLGHRVVTYVGRLDRQKGVVWLLDTASIWLKRLPDCHLLLVGEGPLRPRLQRICDRHGLADRVHFAGWRADVPEILAASDLLLLPSAWEGMPNVILEAMASRLPVVATDVEGVRELLGREAQQQIVPYGKPEAFAEKLVTLLEDPQAAARIGDQNRKRVEENFTPQRMVAGYQDLWESLVQEKVEEKK